MPAGSVFYIFAIANMNIYIVDIVSKRSIRTCVANLELDGKVLQVDCEARTEQVPIQPHDE